MPISRSIVAGDCSPEQAICRIWLGYSQPVDLNVSERVCLLINASVVSTLLLAEPKIGHTFSSAMRFNSLTTACTVAVLPVPGTPEMSVESDQFATSSLKTT